MGIMSCEIRMAGCWYNNALSFCHRMKRRRITTQEELEFCILACTPCHDGVEKLPADEMYRVVTELVEKRNYAR